MKMSTIGGEVRKAFAQMAHGEIFKREVTLFLMTIRN